MKNRKKVMVYAHTHWDREWYRTFQEYRFRLVEVIDMIIDEMLSGELEYFTLDGQTIALNDYLDVKPEKKSNLKSLIKEGRLTIGPWYVLADEFLVNGESLIQNIRLAQQYTPWAKHHSKVAYLPDTFGHTADMAKITTKFGMKNAVLWRGTNPKQSEFIWYSDDGSYLKTFHLAEGYHQDILHARNLSIEEKAEKIQDFLTKLEANSASDILLLPVGSDHMPPVRGLKTLLKELEEHLIDYKFIQGNLEQFFNENKSFSEKAFTHGDLRDCSKNFILPGVYSSRIYLKQWNALLTNQLSRLIEPFGSYVSLSTLDTFEFPDTSYLWKQLIENHPHDSICGCSIDAVHQENEQRFISVSQACDSYLNRLKFTLNNTLPADSIYCLNTSSFPYSGPVETILTEDLPKDLPFQRIGDFEDRHYYHFQDIYELLPATIIKKQHKCLLWADNIPAMTMQQIRCAPIINQVSTESGHLTNGLIDLKVKEDSLTLVDHTTGKTYAGLNKLIDFGDTGDSYNFSPIPNDTIIKADIKKWEIIEKGPIRGQYRLYYSINIPCSADLTTNTRSNNTIPHEVMCDVFIYANSKRIDFSLNWENKAKDHMVQVVFPTDQPITETLAENHFSVSQHTFDPDYDIYQAIPAKKNTELPINTSPFQRFVQANNIALLSEGLHEYEVSKNDLRLTVLRATGFISHAQNLTRAAEAGPNLAVPDNQCLRKLTARYAFTPSTPIENLYKEAEHFMGCLIPLEGKNYTDKKAQDSFTIISLANKELVITSLRKKQDSNAIEIHVLNPTNETQATKITSSFEIASIKETDFLYNTIEKVDAKSDIFFHKGALKAFLLEIKDQ